MKRDVMLLFSGNSNKKLAKELDIPVIALAQLSRGVETRGGLPIPRLADLRESGAIEQDADVVMFIYRPYYYYQDGQTQYEYVTVNGKEISSQGYAQLIFAKHRNGALKDIHLTFREELTRFDNYTGNDKYY